MSDPFGATDCEHISAAFLSQPVNALSSLAFVVAGVLIARQPGRRLFGAAVASIGVGSFVAHGPRWPGSDWMHDVTIAWVLVLIAAEGAPRWVTASASVLVAVLLAVAPAANNPLLVVLAVVAIGRPVLRRRREVRVLASFTVLGIGAAIGTLSRTGWPWCDPEALLQGHAVWHLLAAAALLMWGTTKSN